jgi:HEAT repeat protein
MDWQNLPEWIRYGIMVLIGTTLGALIALFREALIGFLRRLGEYLSKLLGQKWADRHFERRYVKWMASECEKVSLIGVLPARSGREPRLSEVFVLPALSEEYLRGRRHLYWEGELHPPAPEEWIKWEERMPEETRPVPLPEALRRRTLVVLGEPGAGKTTLLRYLALAHARALTGDASLLRQMDPRAERRLPVFLPLREAAAAERPWAIFAEEYVRRQTQRTLDPPPGYFKRQARRGRCLFLLDGLDEVLGRGDEAYQSICNAVNALAAVEKKNRFIVTSRIAGWRGMLSHNFSILTITPFDRPRREEFIRKWYQAAEASAVEGKESPDQAEIRRRRARERAEDLIRAVEGNDRLRRLATNSMLLSVMAMVHRVDVTLPRDRATLYRRFAELLLERWDVGRGIKDQGATGLTLRQKESLMCQIGYHFHERGVRFPPRREVERLIADALPSLGQSSERAGELLDWVERRTGLLADGEYMTFAHLAFQEYFAAGAIVSDPNLRNRLLQPDRLFDPWWREVVLLYVGMANDATDFIRQVYSPEADDLLRRRLFLAGQCIGEATWVGEELRQEIRAALLWMWRNGYRKQQGEALRVLSRWSDREVRDFFLMALKNKDKDEEPKVRADAAMALGRLGVADPETLQTLREALKDEHTGVRTSAAEALGDLGATDPQTLQALREALRDENPWVRASAAMALGRLGVADPETLQTLRGALRDKEPIVRIMAAMALGRLGVADPETLQTLRGALRDKEPIVRIMAAMALEHPGVADQETLQALREALRDKKPVVRMSTAWVLRHLRVADQETLQALREALRDKAPIVRRMAAGALGRLGVADPETLQTLRGALRDENPWVRVSAAEALGDLGATDPQTLEALREVFRGEDPIVRTRTALALGRLGVADPEVLQTLREALRDDDDWMRDAAFSVLWEISKRPGVWIERDT